MFTTVKRPLYDVDGWHDMASAPKDGVEIQLLWHGRCKLKNGKVYERFCPQTRPVRWGNGCCRADGWWQSGCGEVILHECKERGDRTMDEFEVIVGWRLDWTSPGTLDVLQTTPDCPSALLDLSRSLGGSVLDPKSENVQAAKAST